MLTTLDPDWLGADIGDQGQVNNQCSAQKHLCHFRKSPVFLYKRIQLQMRNH